TLKTIIFNSLHIHRKCSIVYLMCRRRYTKQHYRKFNLHKVTSRKFSAVTQLCEQDVHIPSDNVSGCIRVCTKHKPEWRMENMMQPEWNQQSLHHTEHEHTECRRFFHQEI